VRGAPNITVAEYVPQSEVLPFCDAVVAHGGFHTVIGALMHGVPLVLLPIGGDNGRNAEWTALRGAAVVLGPDERTAVSIRSAIRAVLHDPAYRCAAERLQSAIADLPPISVAVGLVEQLATERRPLERLRPWH
jgi:UDP:flavonoid glycosyltransferase YjiC (YdhE family)